MRKIKVISRKYGGAPRDEYHTNLFAEDDETLRVYSPPGLMYFDHRMGSWNRSPDGLLEIYFKRKWYTVWHICEQISNQNLMYVHISMPATLTEGVLEWVDLDLDYRVHLDGSIERLDEDEFHGNIHELEYPAEVIARAWSACEEVERLLQEEAFPFNHKEQTEIYRSVNMSKGET